MSSTRGSEHAIPIDMTMNKSSSERIQVHGPTGEKQGSFIIRKVDVEEDSEHKRKKSRRPPVAWLARNYNQLSIISISSIVALLVFFLNELSGSSAGDIGFLEVPLFIWCGVPAVYSLVVLVAEPLAVVFVKLIHLLTVNSSRSLKIIGDALCEKLPIVTFFFCLYHVLVQGFLNQKYGLFSFTSHQSGSYNTFETLEMRLVRQALMSVCVIMSLIACGNAFLGLLHRSLTLFIFRHDVPNVILQNDVLNILSCETNQQKLELQERWSQESKRYSILSKVDELREAPLRLHLQPLLFQQRISRWIYASNSLVDVTSMSQMRAVSDSLLDNVFKGANAINFRQWLAIFGNDIDAAEEAFEVFFGRLQVADEDSITKFEFRHALFDCFKQRRFVQARIQNYDSLFDVIRSLLSLVFCMPLSLVVAKIFNLSPYSFITVFSSLIAVLAFALPSTMYRLFVSILFIFAINPYEVGDRVSIEDQDFFVKSIHLLSTDFVAIDNMHMNMSNSELASVKIFNHRRSKRAVIEFKVMLARTTPQATIEVLKASIVSYLKARPDMWMPTLVTKVDDLKHLSSICMKVQVTNRLNWQEVDVSYQHKLGLSEHIRSEMKKLGIEAADPIPEQYM